MNWATVIAMGVVLEEEGNGKGGKSNGDSNE
jgi:hypothetical protein